MTNAGEATEGEAVKWELQGVFLVLREGGDVRAFVFYAPFSRKFYGVGVFGDSEVFTPCLYEDTQLKSLQRALEEEYRLAYPKKGKP